jgi:hypothetical protein
MNFELNVILIHLTVTKMLPTPIHDD